MTAQSRTIAIGCDHAGYEYRKYIIDNLSEEITFVDFGTETADSVDYPDFAHRVAAAVSNNEADLGILICGTGNGVAMTANKYADIRAGLSWTKEIAALTRQHNDANIVCIPARYTSKQQALAIVNTFLNTPFEGGRHERRVNKICM